MTTYDLRNKLIQSKEKMPIEKHWAIIVWEGYSIHHEADERSKTHPGHGYPAYTESGVNTEYYAFNNETEWKDALAGLEENNANKNRYSEPKKFIGIEVAKVARIITKIEVK